LQLPNTNTAAILIFANSPGIDAARKGIPKSGQLFSVLNAEIVRKVEKTGLPYFIYSEELQIGSDFGARFTAAIQSLFSKGYDSIITVGNDTPNLSVPTLMESYEKLVQGKTVIGPSIDGGIYLLGIHRNRFEPISFRQLPWQKANLFQEVARFFLRKGMLHQLPRLTDIDSIDDIQAVIDYRESISLELLRILLLIARKKQMRKAHRFNRANSRSIERPFNKGSPSYPSIS